VSHPDPNGAAATQAWRVGDVLWNPVTRERAVLLETPLDNAVGRARAEMTALVGSRVLGEHLHPGLIERFTVLEGQLTVRRDGRTGKLREGEAAEIRAGQWHDWWNAEDHDARVIVEVEPGARFAHMLETLFGLAEMGYVDEKGMPNLLQMALVGREFSDTVQFRSPPPAMQKVLFAAIAPLAHAMGYRATYPQLSRSLLGPGQPEAMPAAGAAQQPQDGIQGVLPQR